MTLLYGDALEIIESRIAGIAEIERIRLSEAAGRVLAADLIAKTALPPADASAMDGFAFAFTPGVTRYRRMAGRSAAGHPFDGVVPPGHALRILTGAMMPPGTDTVATQESCTVTEDGIEVPASLSLGANRRLCGEDVRAGSVVLTKGTRLTAPALGLAAAAGFGEVTVARRLRVAVFSTGDELVEPGHPLPPGALNDANRPWLMAMLSGWGAEVTDLGILPDRAVSVRDSLAWAGERFDLIVTSGGVSMGDEDHVRHAVATLGGFHFEGLAIKPGKPVSLGWVGGAAFLGLPGNPVAGMITFLMIGRVLADRLSGAVPSREARIPAIAGFSHPRKPGRREWLRARLRTDGDHLVVECHPQQGSAMLSSMVWADGLVEIGEAAGPVAPGDPVTFLSLAEMLR